MSRSPIDLSFLSDLLMAPGVTGHEEPVKEVWKAHMSRKGVEVLDRPGGNCYARVRPAASSKPLRVYLSAHCDEIGFIVTYVTDDGFVYFSPIDDDLIDSSAIRAKKVRIMHKGKPVTGVIGHTPFHCLPSKPSEKVAWHDLWIDIGASSKKEALGIVSVGDPISIERGVDVLNERMLVSGALDDRTGCAVVAEVFLSLLGKLKNIELIAGIHVQEEVDQRGAQMAAQHWKPDVNICVDVDFALDHPETDIRGVGKAELGKGPVIVHNACLSKTLTEGVVEVARKNALPIQQLAWSRPLPADPFVMSKVDHGIPTAFVGIPLRYMHTNVETVSVDDLGATVQLLRHVLLWLDRDAQDLQKKRAF